MNVIFLESLLYNPYRNLLIQNLQKKDVKIDNLDAFSPKNFVFLFKLIGKNKKDIVHFHELRGHTRRGRNTIITIGRLAIFLMQLIILKLLDIKLVWTVHEWEDRLYGGKWNIPKVYRLIIGQMFDAIITHCETTKKEIIKELKIKKEKVFIVPHGNYIIVLSFPIEYLQLLELPYYQCHLAKPVLHLN
jgi:glycosyltransferase involved in cell wall biosynthesis